MSHYTVLVITDDTTTVDGLLAPFDENAEMEPYIDMTHAEAIESMRSDFAEAVARYEKAIVEEPERRWTLIPDWTDKIDWDAKVTLTPEVIADFKAKTEAYTDEELFTQFVAYHGIDDDRLDEDGNVYSTYNPDSKWDWYCEGGRWGGGIPTKDGGRDFCAVVDIDWTPDEGEAKAAERYWEVVVEGDEMREDEDERDFWCMYKPEYFLDRYGTKEQYVNEYCAFSTYAVLTPDGEWHEAGPMGWFGMCGGSGEEHRAFKAGYEALVRQYEDGCNATLVDCHI